MFYLRQECTRVAKERITQSLQQVQTTIERSKVEEMFRESSQQLKALEVCEDVNAWVYNAFSIISLLFFTGQTFHWTDIPSAKIHTHLIDSSRVFLNYAKIKQTKERLYRQAVWFWEQISQFCFCFWKK